MSSKQLENISLCHWSLFKDDKTKWEGSDICMYWW